MAGNGGMAPSESRRNCEAKRINGDHMWQVVKEDPASLARVPAKDRGAAWQVLRAAVAPVVRREVQFEPRVERVERRVEDQPVGVKARVPQPPRSGVGVGVVEAVVLLAVAAYFVAGFVGVLVS